MAEQTNGPQTHEINELPANATAKDVFDWLSQRNIKSFIVLAQDGDSAAIHLSMQLKDRAAVQMMGHTLIETVIPELRDTLGPLKGAVLNRRARRAADRRRK